MYNHYQGNTGRVRRVDDAAALTPRQSRGRAEQAPAPPAQNQQQPRQSSVQQQPQQSPVPQQSGAQGGHSPPPRPVSAPGPGSRRPGPLGGLSGELGKLLNKLSPMNLETDDLILAMILYLMYRESRDEELLYIMAAMFLL